MHVNLKWLSLLVILATGLRAFAADGVVNSPRSVWQVLYHKDDKNPKSDAVAIRLQIASVSGNAISATLWRYDRVKSKPGMGNKKQYQAKDDGAKVTLAGQSPNKGEGANRKRETFQLFGQYTDGQNKNHIVMLKGYFITGNDKTSTADDRLIVRVIDKKTGQTSNTRIPTSILAQVADEPCDEMPPDEDVMEEELVPDPETPPDYDAEG